MVGAWVHEQDRWDNVASFFELAERRRQAVPMRCVVVMSVLFGAVAVQAQSSVHAGATILSFPRMVSGADVDTMVQIGNLSNFTVHAHCFYSTAANNQRTTSDFELVLLSQQSLRWQVSAGRAYDVMLQAGDPPLVLPVVIPPVVSSDFHGELMCVEVDASGYPFNGNHLTGMATLRSSDGSESATYLAIGLSGNPELPPSPALPLDGEAYDTCPDTWVLSHRAAGTAFTIVPCAHDFENNTVPTIDVQFSVTNRNLETLTASTTLSGWAEVPLVDLDPDGEDHASMDAVAIGTDYARTTISSVGGGILVVGQDLGTSSGTVDTALNNLVANGTRADSDAILLPPLVGGLP